MLCMKGAMHVHNIKDKWLTCTILKINGSLGNLSIYTVVHEVKRFSESRIMHEMERSRLT